MNVRKSAKPAAAVLSAALLLSANAQAQINFTIANASFQSPTTTTFTNRVVDDWTFDYNNGATPPGFLNWGVQKNTIGYTGFAQTVWDGDQYGFFNTAGTNDVGFFQSNSPVGTLTGGNVYTLEVLVGLRTDNPANGITYEIGLVDLDLDTELGTFTSFTPATVNTVTDVTYTLDVDAEASGSVGNEFAVRIRGISNNGTPQMNFDNVRLSAVPEPTTSGLLLGLACLGMLLRRRRRS